MANVDHGAGPDPKYTRGLKRKIDTDADETIDYEDSSDSRYEKLSTEKKTKLNKYLDKMIATASIDYSDAEMKDLQSAVHEFIETLARRVTERGILKINRVQPCGSMAERTGVWKLHIETNEVYTEFDYLAMIEGSIDTETNTRLCCLPIKSIFIEPEYLGRFRRLSYQIRGGTYPSKDIQRIFLIELSTCLNPPCGCYCVRTESLTYGYTGMEGKLLINSTAVSTDRCTQCCVDTPTGILSVDTSKEIEFDYVISPKPSKRNRCSIVLLWNSKTRSSFALANGQRALPVYIDFLPAIESESSMEGVQQVVVSKSCSVDRNHFDWRRSTNKEEVEYIEQHMSDVHIKCYKILKCLLQVFMPSQDIPASQYLIRMIALDHDKICNDSIDDCARCILKILSQLGRAVEKKELKQFNSSVNLISNKGPSSDAEHTTDFIEEVTNGILSITDNDSFASFVDRLSNIIGKCIQAQDWNKLVTDERKTESILQFFNVIKACSVHLEK